MTLRERYEKFCKDREIDEYLNTIIECIIDYDWENLDNSMIDYCDASKRSIRIKIEWLQNILDSIKDSVGIKFCANNEHLLNELKIKGFICDYFYSFRLKRHNSLEINIDDFEKFCKYFPNDNDFCLLTDTTNYEKDKANKNNDKTKEKYIPGIISDKLIEEIDNSNSLNYSYENEENFKKYGYKLLELLNNINNKNVNFKQFTDLKTNSIMSSVKILLNDDNKELLNILKTIRECKNLRDYISKDFKIDIIDLLNLSDDLVGYELRMLNETIPTLEG